MELLQGTLDLLILKTLTAGRRHGWSISKRIEQISLDILSIKQGSLYPALHRLEERGWIAADWGVSGNNRRAKYYALTRAGRKRLERETQTWKQFSAAVNLVLQGT